ncbi:MAG: hypothetical protein DRQ43_10295 [Gammaproteobacteria bacterium]|nr:MAG: hypothetical protein DRQ43_10295 [Gammaproteobacteria bacterium]
MLSYGNATKSDQKQARTEQINRTILHFHFAFIRQLLAAFISYNNILAKPVKRTILFIQI